jgi:hypothetical protein
MSVQDETEARWIPGGWRGASEAHIRSDLQRASNEAGSPEDKRISLTLNGIWNKAPAIQPLPLAVNMTKYNQIKNFPHLPCFSEICVHLRPSVVPVFFIKSNRRIHDQT